MEDPWERAVRMYEDDEIDVDPLDPDTMPPVSTPTPNLPSILTILQRIEFGRDYWEALGTTAWCHRDRKEGKDLQRSLDKAWPLIPRDELPRNGEPFDKLYFRLSEKDLHELNSTTQQLKAEIAEQQEKHRAEISSLDQKLRDSWNKRPIELRNIPAFDLMDKNMWLLRALAYPLIMSAKCKHQQRSKATKDLLSASIAAQMRAAQQQSENIKRRSDSIDQAPSSEASQSSSMRPPKRNKCVQDAVGDDGMMEVDDEDEAMISDGSDGF